jgi:hypothetical protein
MLRLFRRRFIIAALAISSVAAADPAVRMPPGTRAEDDHFVSTRGLRDTTDFVAKELASRGIATARVGPYRERSVELTRFLSQDPATTWLAIHVVRISGKTLIFFVPRPKP